MDRNKISGYSLLELMVVIAIIAIIAAFAIPAYQNYMEKANLAEASNKCFRFANLWKRKSW